VTGSDFCLQNFVYSIRRSRELKRIHIGLIPRSGASGNWGKTLFRLSEIVQMYFKNVSSRLVYTTRPLNLSRIGKTNHGPFFFHPKIRIFLREKREMQRQSCDDWDLPDHRREATRIQNHRSIPLGSRGEVAACWMCLVVCARISLSGRKNSSLCYRNKVSSSGRNG
jgi:hypothetical protein